MAIAGPPATLPLRYAVAGMLSGIQVGVAAAARARPEIRTRVSNGMRRAFPGAGFGPRADRLEDWRWKVTVAGRTASGARVDVRADAEGAPRLPRHGPDDGRGRSAARRAGRDAEQGRLPDAGDRARGRPAPERFESARLRFSVAT